MRRLTARRRTSSFGPRTTPGSVRRTQGTEFLPRHHVCATRRRRSVADDRHLPRPARRFREVPSRASVVGRDECLPDHAEKAPLAACGTGHDAPALALASSATRSMILLRHGQLVHRLAPAFTCCGLQVAPQSGPRYSHPGADADYGQPCDQASPSDAAVTPAASRGRCAPVFVPWRVGPCCPGFRLSLSTLFTLLSECRPLAAAFGNAKRKPQGDKGFRTNRHLVLHFGRRRRGLSPALCRSGTSACGLAAQRPLHRRSARRLSPLESV